MIHSIILNMLDPFPASSTLSNILNASENFSHPSELEMMKEILKLVEIYRDIRNFVFKYSAEPTSSKNEATDLPKGLYLEALAHSVDLSLDPFRNKVIELERQHIKNAHLPVCYFLAEIKEFEIFLHFLKRFIDELNTQKFHGCAILGLLHKYDFHADMKSMQALKTIRGGVYSVFLQQLSHWLIYGRIVDKYGEFFITHSDLCNKKYMNPDGMATTTGLPNGYLNRIDSTTTSGLVSTNMANTNVSLWQYQVLYDMIPLNLTTSFAEKVLFIGQTVCMLIDEPRQSAKKVSVWSEDDDHVEEMIGSLWNNKEYSFFNQIQMLYNCNGIDIGSYEQVVNEIKRYVTARLSEIAFNQADLIKHLRLFKDYYLLGRGELFLEFINQLKKVKADGVAENLTRDVNQAFQKALCQSSIDFDQITMNIQIDDTIDSTCSIIKLIRLNFNVKWPLHLFFSPRVLELYSEMFSFLLQIRHIQNELHLVWRIHRGRKVSGNSILSQLRNKMLFFINNLQYYLHVDVLESQFCGLINSVQNSNFEHTQRAHTIFQANIMSLSFLLNTDIVNDPTSQSTSQKSENPVYTILNNILITIESFCNFNQNTEYPIPSEIMQQLNLIDERFSNNMHELLKLLNNRMAGPASEPLAQLLLRLDFNYWFSSGSN